MRYWWREFKRGACYKCGLVSRGLGFSRDGVEQVHRLAAAAAHALPELIVAPLSCDLTGLHYHLFERAKEAGRTLRVCGRLR